MAATLKDPYHNQHAFYDAQYESISALLGNEDDDEPNWPVLSHRVEEALSDPALPRWHRAEYHLINAGYHLEPELQIGWARETIEDMVQVLDVEGKTAEEIEARLQPLRDMLEIAEDSLSERNAVQTETETTASETVASTTASTEKPLPEKPAQVGPKRMRTASDKIIDSSAAAARGESPPLRTTRKPKPVSYSPPKKPKSPYDLAESSDEESSDSVAEDSVAEETGATTTAAVQDEDDGMVMAGGDEEQPNDEDEEMLEYPDEFNGFDD